MKKGILVRMKIWLAEKANELNDSINERRVISFFREQGRPSYANFNKISCKLGMDRVEVGQTCRSLASKGRLKYVNCVVDGKGRYCGSAYLFIK